MEQIYHELMHQLSTIHQRIAAARKTNDDARKASKDAERNTDMLKAEIVIAAGGYSALGKNADDREYALQAKLNADRLYPTALATQRKAEQYQAETSRQLEDLKTEFDSLRIQASLHGDFLRYSALVAAKPEAASLMDL